MVPDDFFGISPDRSPLNPEDFELLDDFNATWIRTTVRWTGVEPKEGTWNFTYWDNYVAKAAAAEKKIIFGLGFDNTWLYSDNKEHRDLTDREIPYFLKYVEQLVSRYRDRVVFEIWNEPNWVFWDGSNEHFFALASATAKKIQEIYPDAVVLGGSTLRAPGRFTNGLFKSGAMENTDGYSFHPYAVNPQGSAKQIDKLIKIMDKYGYNKPIYVTEMGYSTGPISFCNIKHYPEYIVKTLSGIAIRADRVRNVIWYELMDEHNPGEAPNPLNPLNYFGLIYPNKTFKPGAEAFMLTAHHLAGSEYAPELLQREGVNKGITSLFFRKPDGTNTLILWKNSPGKQKLRLSVLGEAAELFGHSLLTGEAFPLPVEIPARTSLASTAALEIGREPVFITWAGTGTPQLSK